MPHQKGVRMIEKRLRDLDFAGLRDRQFTASPAAWEDQVLYFLMLDRFSDGREMANRDSDGQVVAGTLRWAGGAEKTGYLLLK